MKNPKRTPLAHQLVAEYYDGKWGPHHWPPLDPRIQSSTQLSPEDYAEIAYHLPHDARVSTAPPAGPISQHTLVDGSCILLTGHGCQAYTVAHQLDHAMGDDKFDLDRFDAVVEGTEHWFETHPDHTTRWVFKDGSALLSLVEGWAVEHPTVKWAIEGEPLDRDTTGVSVERYEEGW